MSYGRAPVKTAPSGYISLSRTFIIEAYIMEVDQVRNVLGNKNKKRRKKRGS